MSPRWRDRLWKLALLVAMVVVAWLMLSPADEVPRGPQFPLSDKVQHALLFLGLALVAARAYAELPVWGIFASLVLYGAALEIAQGRMGRSADALDLLADALGASVVFLAAPRRTPAPRSR